jgi:hypothetical protein
VRARLLAAVCLAAVGALASPALAQECPTQTFLAYDGLVYASERVTASNMPAGSVAGPGTIDEPVGDNPCERRREDVTVVGAGDLDPRVAVTVQGRPGLLFVVGARCDGYEGDEREACLLEPLVFDARTYTEARYPDMPAPDLPASEEALGEAELGGEPVTAQKLVGILPEVGVGVESRPDVVYVAAGACPYESFSSETVEDDLRRCLSGPLWLVFDPLGARVGEEIVARADREVPAVLAGAQIALVRLRVAADIVPRDLSGAVRIGTITGGDAFTLPFTVPDVAQGIYEAVITCEACRAAYGRTTFPAGSVLVFERQGASIPAWSVIGIGFLFLVLLGVSIVAWRKGWGRRRRAE